MGGGDGDIRLPSRPAQPWAEEAASHNDGFTIPTPGFVWFEIQLPPACLGGSPALGSARETNIKCISTELKEYSWYLMEFSWSSSRCFFWVHAFFICSLVSHTFRREILSELASVGQSRSQVVTCRCSGRPTFSKLTFGNVLVSSGLQVDQMQHQDATQ